MMVKVSPFNLGIIYAIVTISIFAEVFLAAFMLNIHEGFPMFDENYKPPLPAIDTDVGFNATLTDHRLAIQFNTGAPKNISIDTCIRIGNECYYDTPLPEELCQKTAHGMSQIYISVFTIIGVFFKLSCIFKDPENIKIVSFYDLAYMTVSMLTTIVNVSIFLNHPTVGDAKHSIYAHSVQILNLTCGEFIEKYDRRVDYCLFIVFFTFIVLALVIIIGIVGYLTWKKYIQKIKIPHVNTKRGVTVVVE